jgi:ABC-type branched-subunit amino acid transport system permease subunit
MTGTRFAKANWLVCAACAAAATGYAALVMAVESEAAVLALLAVGVAAAVIVARTRLGRLAAEAFGDGEGALNVTAVLGMIALTVVFYDDHFALFMIATVLLYVVVCLGLNIQFGYAGILNFAGAAFFGAGSYTAAVLTEHSQLPHLLVILAGGMVAALIGSLLILPVLRTRGHYAALVTIAFAILFKTFLEVNDTLGGPQGLRVEGMSVLGWNFNDNIELGLNTEISFYVNYVAASLILLVLAFAFTRRLERSWIGLNFDAIRLDEVASACFGVSIARWRTVAFVAGNFLVGMAGALFAMMIGFIAPANFTFGDSLIFVSIVLLGGLGSPWGVVVASSIIVILPEKLQIIQEYRFLLFAALVIAMLLFRPSGLIPRGLRAYFPGWTPR